MVLGFFAKSEDPTESYTLPLTDIQEHTKRLQQPIMSVSL